MRAFINIDQNVVVTIDRAKFSEEFMREFRECFYPFDTIEEHLRHLATLYARGIAYNGGFIEGYGEAEAMGIKLEEDTGIEASIWELEDDVMGGGE